VNTEYIGSSHYFVGVCIVQITCVRFTSDVCFLHCAISFFCHNLSLTTLADNKNSVIFIVPRSSVDLQSMRVVCGMVMHYERVRLLDVLVTSLSGVGYARIKSHD